MSVVLKKRQNSLARGDGNCGDVKTDSFPHGGIVIVVISPRSTNLPNPLPPSLWRVTKVSLGCLPCDESLMESSLPAPSPPSSSFVPPHPPPSLPPGTRLVPSVGLVCVVGLTRVPVLRLLQVRIRHTTRRNGPGDREKTVRDGDGV